MRVLLVGYGTLALGVLRGLLDSPRVRVAGVVRWGAGFERAMPPDADHRAIATVARAADVPLPVCDRVNSAEFTALLRRLEVDWVLVASWGEILREPVIRASGGRIVNCHPSLLPAHRGANPYASAIIAGESWTGVTFHLIDAGIDTGPVVAQARVPIDLADTGGTLRSRCARVAREMVPSVVDRLATPGLVPRAQAEMGEASYHGRLSDADAVIDFRRPAREVHDRIRAVQPWYLPRTWAEGPLGRVRIELGWSRVEPVRIGAAAPGAIVSRDGATLRVACAGGELVRLGDLRLGVGWLALGGRLARPVGRWLIPDAALLGDPRASR
ncbi:MAG: methionyl-tRNA formyltransferase [Ectothiorhodospiraceae bacterium]|nr:methionyl-tRNA formyltransferase [Ectothiorhodospiraceae bacterium]